MSFNNVLKEIPGLSQFVSGDTKPTISSVSKPQKIITNGMNGMNDTSYKIRVFFGIFIVLYIIAKGIQRGVFKLKNYKSAMEESSNFVALLIYCILIMSFTNDLPINDVGFYVSIVAGMFLPSILGVLDCNKIVAYILGAIFIVSYLANFYIAGSSQTITQLFITIAMVLILLIGIYSVPPDKRLQTVQMASDGKLVPGATFMLFSPKLRVGSPLLLLMGSIGSANLNPYIFGLFIGAFIGSLALYGNLWLYTDETIVQPETPTINLNQTIINELQSSSDVETLKWSFGLIIILIIMLLIFLSAKI